MMMVAPHTLREPLVLHRVDQPGLFKLVAADATGGVLLAYDGAEQPETGSLLSFHPVDHSFGPVRLLARALEPVTFPGSVSVHMAVQWVALTAAENAKYLVRVLDLVGVRVHLPKVDATVASNRELVYEPATQRVRMIRVSAGFRRSPTQEIAKGIAPSQVSDTQPAILVETLRSGASGPDNVRWYERTDDSDTTRSEVVVLPDAPAPRPSGARRQITIQGITSRLAAAACDPVAIDPAGFPGNQDSAALAAPSRPGRRREWAGDPEGGWRPDALWSGGGQDGKLSRYRLAPEADPAATDRVSTLGRSPAAAVVSRFPEFARKPASGEVTIGGEDYAMVCTALGQRSCIFEVNVVGLTVGTEARVGVPADPCDEGLLWVTGVIETVEPLEGVSEGARLDVVRVQVRLARAVSRDYRRLVQYWSRQSANK